jgi:hypothetical protein|nr:MAG TPA: hypothetical protein [Caudoviricetes sp.]
MSNELIIPNMTESEAERMDRFYRYALSKDEMRRFGAELRQRQIAAVAEKLAPDRYGALGEQVLEVDPEIFFAWDVLHSGCWGDKSFIREFARDNSACRAIKPNRRIFNGVSLNA